MVKYHILQYIVKVLKQSYLGLDQYKIQHHSTVENNKVQCKILTNLLNQELP